MAGLKPGGPPPEFVEHEGYGLWPCANEWHGARRVEGISDTCPDCPNTWWAFDGTGCPEEYALIAEIDWLRGVTAYVYVICFDQDTFGIFRTEAAAEADLRKQISEGGPAWDMCEVKRWRVCG